MITTPSRHYVNMLMLAVILELAACHKAKERETLARDTKNDAAVPLQRDSDVNITNNNASSPDVRPPENILSYQLPEPDLWIRAGRNSTAAKPIVLPVVEALHSPDPVKQRAALVLIGVSQGSIPNPPEKYRSFSEAVKVWAVCSYMPARYSIATEEQTKEIKENKRRFIKTIDEIIGLYDANNSLLVRKALFAVLGLKAPLHQLKNQQEMEIKWHESPLYQRITEEINSH